MADCDIATFKNKVVSYNIELCALICAVTDIDIPKWADPSHETPEIDMLRYNAMITSYNFTALNKNSIKQKIFGIDTRFFECRSGDTLNSDRALLNGLIDKFIKEKINVQKEFLSELLNIQKNDETVINFLTEYIAVDSRFNSYLDMWKQYKQKIDNLL